MKNLPCHGERLDQLISDLKKGWTGYAGEITELMNLAAEVLESKEITDLAHREIAQLQLNK